MTDFHPSLLPLKCAYCRELFGSDGAFAAHRGSRAPDEPCVGAAQCGQLIRRDGIWHTEPARAWD